MESNMPTYDIVIIGGGIVGAMTALMLAQHSTLQIALIEQNAIALEWDENKFDHRVSAISPNSQHIFQKSNVWQHIQAKRLSPYKKMFVWDAEGQGKLEFDCRSVHLNALGYIIENSVIRTAIYQECVKKSNLKLLASLKLKKLEENENQIAIVCEDNAAFSTRLLIGADGGSSWVRSQMAIESHQHDYDHCAIVTKVETELPHNATAFQCFLKKGPLAFLPLSQSNEASIVWSTHPEEVKHLLGLKKASFEKELERAFENKLGKVKASEKRFSFPLQMRHAKQYVKSGIALVGDAAHTIHPLAGQGVNLGLLDSVCLVGVILAALRKNKDFSSYENLRPYERERKSENTIMLASVDAIKKIFSTDSRSLKELRNIGMQITNQINPLKNFFVKYASGVNHNSSFLT